MSSTPRVIKSFLSIFYISKYFGCNLYPLPRELNTSNLKISIRAMDVLMYLIHVLISLLIAIPFINKWGKDDSVYRKEFMPHIIRSSGVIVVNIVARSLNYTAIVINLFVMMIDMRNSGVIRSILLSFMNFDEEMERQGVKITLSYKRISLLHGFIILLLHLMITGFSFLALKLDHGRLIFIIEMYVGTALMDGCACSLLLTYWYLISNLADRFCIINNCLRQYSGALETDKSPLTVDFKRHFSNNLDLVSIHNLSKVHQILVNIVPRINHCYALQLIFIILMVFSFLVVNVFLLYQRLIFGNDLRTPLIGVFYTCRTLYYNLILYKIISTGSKIKKERKISQALVNKVISLTQNKVVSVQLNHFCYQIGHSNVDITCGLFTVDWTLFYTLTSAMGTYLLLFVQFDSTVTMNV